VRAPFGNATRAAWASSLGFADTNCSKLKARYKRGSVDLAVRRMSLRRRAWGGQSEDRNGGGFVLWAQQFQAGADCSMSSDCISNGSSRSAKFGLT